MLFVFGRSTLAVVAAVNVLLIFGSIYLLMSPTEGESHGATEEETGESTA